VTNNTTTQLKVRSKPTTFSCKQHFARPTAPQHYYYRELASAHSGKPTSCYKNTATGELSSEVANVLSSCWPLVHSTITLHFVFAQAIFWPQEILQIFDLIAIAGGKELHCCMHPLCIRPTALRKGVAFRKSKVGCGNSDDTVLQTGIRTQGVENTYNAGLETSSKVFFRAW